MLSRPLKSAYVGALRAARSACNAAGVTAALERRGDNRSALYLRSLLAIHDVEDMVRLDVPWWTFPAIDAVGAFLAAGDGRVKAFEYGPGASTFWLARRCRSVAFVEHDAPWWGTFGPMVGGLANASGRLVEPAPPPAGTAPRVASQRDGWKGLEFAPYVEAIRDAGGPFDLIVIDGRARSACLEEAPRHLAKDGLVVFDNSERRRYRRALEASPLAATPHPGLAPALPYPSRTTILREA